MSIQRGSGHLMRWLLFGILFAHGAFAGPVMFSDAQATGIADDRRLPPTLANPNAPRVGLIYGVRDGKKLRAESDPLRNYRRILLENGATVVEILQAELGENPGEHLSGLHGLLIPGGIDLDPKTYGMAESPLVETPDARFDAFELNIIRGAVERKLAILGICRGMQLLNVFCGGTLYQDIPTQFSTPRGASVVHRIKNPGSQTSEPCHHPIRIESGSLLERLIGGMQVSVTSTHHQGVQALGNGLVVTARAPDGFIEAIEKQTYDGFFLGVQFHPEKPWAEDVRLRQIVRGFVSAARGLRASHP